MFQFLLKASFFSSGEVGVFPIPPPKKALPKKTSMHALCIMYMTFSKTDPFYELIYIKGPCPFYQKQRPWSLRLNKHLVYLY